MSAELIDVFQHDDARLHRNSEKREKTDTRRHTEKSMSNQESHQAADACHGHRDQNQHGPFGRAKHGVENEEYDQDRDRNDDQQSGLGSLLAFIFSGPLDVVAPRQLHTLVDSGYGFLDGGPQISVTHFEPNG